MANKPRAKNKNWSDEEDLMLRNQVIESIEKGKTQLSAFEAFASNNERSSSSVAFRWNNKLRKIYEADLKKAKEISKKTKRKQNQTPPVSENSDVDESLVTANTINSKCQETEPNGQVINIPYELIQTFIQQVNLLEKKYHELEESYTLLQQKNGKMKTKFDELIDLAKEIN